MMDFNDIEQRDRMLNEMKSYTNLDEMGWTHVKTSSNGQVSCRPSPIPDFEGNLCEGVVNASPSDALKYCKPRPDMPRAKWDEVMRNFTVVDNYRFGMNPELYVIRTVSPSVMMGVISARDFVDLVMTHEEPNFAAVIAESIDHPNAQPDDKVIRGFNYLSGTLFYNIPGETDKSRLFYFIQTNIGGNVPMYLVESFLPGKMINFINNLNTYIKKTKR